MPAPRKSKVWNYFVQTINGERCNLCEKEVSGKGYNTSNLARHLRRIHSIEIQPHPSLAGK